MRRHVVAAANIRRDAIPPEMLAQQAQVGPEAAQLMTETPMYQLYQRVAPRPEDFPKLLGKVGASMAQDFDFSGSGCHVGVGLDDHRRHLQRSYLVAEAFKLLDGGLRDGGGMGEGRPKGGHALAILPGLTHNNLATSSLFAAVVLDFLDGPNGS